MSKKTSFHFFKTLKSFTDSPKLLDAEKDKNVCKIIDDFIDNIKEPAREQIKTSIEMGLVEGFLTLDEWQDEVAKIESEDVRLALLGKENGFTRSKLIVTCNYETSTGHKKEGRFSMPAPFSPMMNHIEARKVAREKYLKPAITDIKTVLSKEYSKEAQLEM